MGGIQRPPADAGNENLRPRMGGAGLFGGQITADIKRGNLQRAAQADHDMGKILANPAALLQHAAHVRVDGG